MAVEHQVEALSGRAAVLLVPVHPKLLDGRPEPKDTRVDPTLLHKLREQAAALHGGDRHPLHGGHEGGETNVPATRMNAERC